MTKKKARKPVRYRTIRLKVTSRQKRSLENFCKSRGTTPNKIIKKSIRPLLENYASAVPVHQQVSVNQLKLFGAE
jgi:hypothetical protein